MKRAIIGGAGLMAMATAVQAHPGTHVHPHDGAHWLVVVAALSVLALAGGVFARRRAVRQRERR